MGGDMGAGSDPSTGGGGGLQDAIKQLQDTAATFTAQVEAVAEAAGMPPSGTEGSPEEESGETPAAEGAEGGLPPEGEAGASVPYKKKPAGNVMSFLNGKK